MTPAESLPPLDAGQYLAKHPCFSMHKVFDLVGGYWFNDQNTLTDDPRLSGWTLTPVAAIEKLAEELDHYRRMEAKTYADLVQAHNARDKALADLVAVGAELERVREALANLVDQFRVVHLDMGGNHRYRLENDGAVVAKAVHAAHAILATTPPTGRES